MKYLTKLTFFRSWSIFSLILLIIIFITIIITAIIFLFWFVSLIFHTISKIRNLKFFHYIITLFIFCSFLCRWNDFLWFFYLLFFLLGCFGSFIITFIVRHFSPVFLFLLVLLICFSFSLLSWNRWLFVHFKNLLIISFKL